MENLSYEALVELVTKEVMKALSQGGIAGISQNGNVDARPLALVIGDKKCLPSFAADKYRFADMESYKGDISPFDCVFIAELTCAELADCALGRDCRTVPCAVTNALLCGKKIYLLESALPHRKHKDTANRKFYSVMEGYVNTLRSYDIELIREQWYGRNLNRNAIADNSVDKVITEKLAISLCEKAADGKVCLKRGTVITPSAKDIFNHSEIKVEFVD